MLESENTLNFEAENELLLSVFPSIQTTDTVYLVDGDQTKISVIEKSILRNKVILCIHHFSNNVRLRIIPWIDTMKKKCTKNEIYGESGPVSEADFEDVDVSEDDLQEDLFSCDKLSPSLSSSSSPSISLTPSFRSTLSSSSSASSDITSHETTHTSQSSPDIHDFILMLETIFSSNETGVQSWYKIFSNLRKSPTKEIALAKLSYLENQDLPYAKFLSKNVNKWLLCMFTWEMTFGCQATQLQEGLFASLKRITGYSRMYPHEV